MTDDVGEVGGVGAPDSVLVQRGEGELEEVVAVDGGSASAKRCNNSGPPAATVGCVQCPQVRPARHTLSADPWCSPFARTHALQKEKVYAPFDGPSEGSHIARLM